MVITQLNAEYVLLMVLALLGTHQDLRDSTSAPLYAKMSMLKNTKKSNHTPFNQEELLDEIEELEKLEEEQIEKQEEVIRNQEKLTKLEELQLKRQNSNYNTLIKSMQFALVLLLVIAGVSIAQFQANRSGTVAPNAPESAPLAGGLESCTYSWTVSPERTSPTPTPTPTTTPTPTPSTCLNCDYQVDVYWGPTIKAFKENGKTYRYSNSGPKKKSRLISTRKSKSSDEYPSCNVGDIVPNTEDPIVSDFPCNGKDDPRKFLKAKIDTSKIRYEKGGYVTARVENKHKECTYEVGLASYRMDATLDTPELYDTQEYIGHTTTSIGPREKATLVISVAELNENELQCVDL